MTVNAPKLITPKNPISTIEIERRNSSRARLKVVTTSPMMPSAGMHTA